MKKTLPPAIPLTGGSAYSLLIAWQILCQFTSPCWGVLRPVYPIPKNRLKNAINLSIMACFLTVRFPPPKREIGGISLSMSVPVVLTEPSRKALSIKRRVSSSFRFSSWMIVTSCRSFSSATKVRYSSITSDTSLIPAIKVSISAFLLRSSGLASTAFWIVMRISLSSQWES